MSISWQMQPDYSFIILTYNEALHLPRLLTSISGLQAEVFILDSGSTDDTLKICDAYQVKYTIHPFENHPKQWHKALTIFQVRTPWVIGLDADHIVSAELYQQLKRFKDKNHLGIDGIYFNRKNIFKGKWIKNGGYYPKYLLKMFRCGIGYSDLTEYMDHRFIVPGKTLLWKSHIIEENLKENKISFWIDKHNRYSDLLADEAIERILNPPKKSMVPNFWGAPNEHNAWLKQLWWKTPIYFRPFLYFGYRLIIQKGILDGKTGIIYHFLQCFWFRLIVDIKIEEKLKSLGGIEKRSKTPSWINFIFLFPAVFSLFYGIHLAIIGFTSPGGFYNSYLDHHFNYIRSWRDFDISVTAMFLKALGYKVSTASFSLHVQGKAGFKIVYSCLGYGILSLFWAFIVCYPKPILNRFFFILYGTCIFQILNICRFILLALFWTPCLSVDLHLIFNVLIYTVMIYTIHLHISKKQCTQHN